MAISAIVAGTGFEGRDEIIRKHVRDGMRVFLVREPNNQYDPNAIAVFIEAKTLFGKKKKQIGYIKAKRATRLAEKMDSGAEITAHVRSFYAPPGKEWPRVSLEIECEI